MTAQTQTIHNALVDRMNDLRTGDVDPLDVSVWTREGDDGISRAEILLAMNGPTEIITWDARGAGWGEYLHTGYEPSRWSLYSEDQGAIEEWLESMGYELVS